jgi:hypothetical protein
MLKPSIPKESSTLACWREPKEVGGVQESSFASARLNSTLTTDHASALHRVCSITRRTRLMRERQRVSRSQGCQRRMSASFTLALTSSASW